MSEVESLRYDLRKAHEKIRELEVALDREKGDHQYTARQRDEYKTRIDRAYDAYVAQTHEGYMPQDEYDALGKQNELLHELVDQLSERHQKYLRNYKRQWETKWQALRKVKALQAALGFYADQDNWIIIPDGFNHTYIELDMGRRAQQAMTGSFDGR